MKSCAEGMAAKLCKYLILGAGSMHGSAVKAPRGARFHSQHPYSVSQPSTSSLLPPQVPGLNLVHKHM